jgi:hypothetical protein
MRTAGGQILMLAAVLAFAAGSCGSDQAPSEPDPRRVDLVVGDTLALSGPAAGVGVSAQKAAQLAVEQINDAIAEADVPHTVEIVHRDLHAEGARTATAELLDSGASCLVGPRSRAGMRRVARASAGNALVISPRAPATRLPAVKRGQVVWLPPTGPQRALDPEAGDRDPAASFARLYGSTDPPIGPARTSDGRRFDATVLCYLAAVAAGSGAPSQMARALGSAPRGAFSRSWAELAAAIEDLERGRAIVYSGVTARIGVHASR